MNEKRIVSSSPEYSFSIGRCGGPQNKWESQACFNPSVWKDPTGFKMVYRALSPKIPYFHNDVNVSTIGYAESPDPIHFVNRRQLISPEYDWEKSGEVNNVVFPTGSALFGNTLFINYGVPFSVPGLGRIGGLS